MNGPLKMYQTKNIIKHDMKVLLPNCMYKLKNIHEPKSAMSNGTVVEQSTEHVSSANKNLDITEQNNCKLPEMAELEKRQEQILKQLADLKKQMLSLKQNLNITSTNGPSANVTTTTTKIAPQKLPDIVVNANPLRPPYSLKTVQKLWQDYMHLDVKTYLHSTIQSPLPENAASLVKSLSEFKPKPNVPKVTLRLIWKTAVIDTELMISHIPILGEANILRYLSRISPELLIYENCQQLFEIDFVLDTCHRLSHSETKTEKNGLLQVISKSLGKASWLVGRNDISVADVAAYSIIKQVVAPNEINVNVSKWLKRCEAVM